MSAFITGSIIPTISLAQSVEVGDQFVTLSYSHLDRVDAGTQRDTSNVMLSYARQQTANLRLMAFLGRATTDNIFPPDTQSTQSPTVGFGASYTFGLGTTVTGTFLYGDISESYTTGGVTTQGRGDTVTGTLQIDQIVPLSANTFLTGTVAASRSNADFQSPGFGVANSPRVQRYLAGIELTHRAGDSWILSAGLDHTHASNIITITGKKHLDRAKLGATYLIDENSGVTVGWVQGINAEATHRRIDFSFTQRF